MKKDFLKAFATLTGTILGVGLFSLPYITSKVGIWVMLFYFLVLGIVVVLIGLFYGEVALRTKGLCRLPGYAGKYLGPSAKKIAFISSGLGLTGSILAYIVVGGSFLSALMGPLFGGSEFFYTIVFFAAGASLIYFGVKSIARIEFFLLILLFVVLALIFNRGFNLIEIKNLFVFDLKYLFLPYGAVLFSLFGASLIPEVKEILKDNPKKLKSVIISAILVSAFVCLVFTFLVLGITGQDTSSEAIAGLSRALNNGVVEMALIFGVLTVFTSFLTLGLTLKKILWYDLKLKKNLAWALACFGPLALFLLGFNNFIAIIGLTGGVFLGIDVILIVLIYLRAKTKGDLVPAYNLNLPRFLAYSLILFFVLGAFYEIFYFIG
ncbi:MAG: aromatic amino acid transport family protein [Patescibacteria group bacterium]|nr:aromatic amino acid transport family protein [Patescibacteria group bacterium]